MLSQLGNLLEVGPAHLANKRTHIVMDQGTVSLKAVLEGKGRRTKLTRKRALIQMHRLLMLAKIPCCHDCIVSISPSESCL